MRIVPSSPNSPRSNLHVRITPEKEHEDLTSGGVTVNHNQAHGKIPDQLVLDIISAEDASSRDLQNSHRRDFSSSKEALDRTLLKKKLDSSQKMGIMEFKLS